MKNNALESINLAFKKPQVNETPYSFAVCFKNNIQASFLKDLLSQSNLKLDLTLVDNFVYKVFPNKEDAKSFKQNFSMFLHYLETSLLKNDFEPNWISNLENDISSLGIVRQYVSSFTDENFLIKEINIKEKSYKADNTMALYSAEKEKSLQELLNYSTDKLNLDLIDFVSSNFIGFKSDDDVKLFIDILNNIFNSKSSDVGFLTKGSNIKTLRLITKKFSFVRFNKNIGEFSESDSIEFDFIESHDLTDSLDDHSYCHGFLDDLFDTCIETLVKAFSLDDIKTNTNVSFSNFTGVDLSYDKSTDLNSRLSFEEIKYYEEEHCRPHYQSLIFSILQYRTEMMKMLQNNFYQNSLIEISKKLNTCHAEDIYNLAKNASNANF